MTLSVVLKAAFAGIAAAATALPVEAAAPNLLSSDPGPESGWTSFPKQLRLTFNEPIGGSDANVQMLGPDGRRIRLSAPSVTKDTLSVTPQLVLTPPVPGPYMITWQAKSASGDQGKGDFSIFVR